MIPHTLGILTLNITYCTLFLECVNESQVSVARGIIVPSQICRQEFAYIHTCTSTEHMYGCLDLMCTRARHIFWEKLGIGRTSY